MTRGINEHSMQLLTNQMHYSLLMLNMLRLHLRSIQDNYGTFLQVKVSLGYLQLLL